MVTCSAPSPLDRVRNTTLYCYRPDPQFPPVKILLNDISINESLMHPIARLVCQLCCLYFCRINEVLSLTIANIIHPDRVLCPGSKRGSAYILYLPGLSDQVSLLNFPESSLPLFPISYIKCYRNFIRAGIVSRKEGRKNFIRCHVGRYKVAELRQKGFELSALSDVLHHKSKSSLSYYLP